MSKITYADGIAILQLLFYLPAVNLAAYLWFRDGFRPGSASWRFATAFTSLRLTGAVCTLIAIHHYSGSLATTIIISQVVGTPPLTMAAIMLVDRINEHTRVVHPLMLKGLSIGALVPLALGIYGADKSLDGSGTHFTPSVYLKVAMAMFIALYLTLVALTFLFGRKWSIYPFQADRTAILAMALCIPFIGVKHIYASLSEYSTIPTFYLEHANQTVYLFMNVLMEMCTVMVLLAFGFKLGSAPQKSQV
ncbi:hypothetical protein CERZMDRAFT_91461 [Cercospora zeae-maydis SCOH1-5]|uniref:DUF7702 domain-containing protein n=1 Tax=Cercospora zeae-maydis SCOH1-5 TaxID=717836 RepID=A0A6A6F623_9PEZI|nr:hypothetical protein CERZMDRAFT_91461 [Cercospora zeae-maydis SCOH1-5]